MINLVLFHAIVFMAIIASVMGAVSILRGLRIFDLKINTRNFMYVGACCAMCFGIIGAVVCLESLLMTKWHYIAAALLSVVGISATIHLSVDFSDRLRISTRN